MIFPPSTADAGSDLMTKAYAIAVTIFSAIVVAAVVAARLDWAAAGSFVLLSGLLVAMAWVRYFTTARSRSK
jgi:hypothetical protein